MKTWWQILTQYESTYSRDPKSASIEIPSFRPNFIQFLKTVSYELLQANFGMSGGISIDPDSRPLRYKSLIEEHALLIFFHPAYSLIYLLSKKNNMYFGASAL